MDKETETNEADMVPVFGAELPARPRIQVIINANYRLAVWVDDEWVEIDYEDAEWFARSVRKAANALERYMQDTGQAKGKDRRRGDL